MFTCVLSEDPGRPCLQFPGPFSITRSNPQLCQVISLPSAILLVLVHAEAGRAEDSLEKIVGKKKAEEEQGMLELIILGN